MLGERVLELLTDRDDVPDVEELQVAEGMPDVHAGAGHVGERTGLLLRQLGLEIEDKWGGRRSLKIEPFQRGTAGKERQGLEHARRSRTVVHRRMLIDDTRIIGG